MNYHKYHSRKWFWHLLTMPLIWAPLPLAICLDLAMELYQQISFPIYGIAKLKRSNYILVSDRNRLAYLNPLEKIGCMYCGYMNGLFAYCKDIAGLTEKYWCGVMHDRKPGFKVQKHQVAAKFAEFGNEKEFHKKYPVK